MNQQQQDMFYGAGYSIANNNRSPSLSRPGYSAASGLHPPHRGNQRQMDPVGQSQYGEDRFNTYDQAFRPNTLRPNQGFPDPFLLNNNNQAWNYNAGAATVNGAMDASGRLRPSNRRAQIPSEWTSGPEQPLNNQGLMPGPTSYPGPPMLNQQNLGLLNGMSNNDRHHYPQSNYGSMPLRTLEEKSNASDLIPTAIVIKNIPFNIRKETLTQMMTDMLLPQPYAFNYHSTRACFAVLPSPTFKTLRTQPLSLIR